jgi:hypothetical protein
MKYIASIVIFLALGLFVGFIAGYLFTRNEVNVPLNPTTIVKHTTTSNQNPPSISTQSVAPAEAILFEQIKTERSIFSKLRLTHELAAESDFEQLKSYITRAAASRDPLYNYNLASVFLEKMTSLDPLGTIAFIESNSALSNTRFIGHVVTSWVREDPEAALDYFRSIDNPRLKNEIAGRLLADPTLADSVLAAEIEGAFGSSPFAIRGLIQANQLPPARALEEALEMTHPSRLSAIQFALIRWLRDDPEEAIARIQSHPNTNERNQMLQSIMHEYLNIDEDAAFILVRESFSGNVQLEQQMLSMLGQRNPKRALPMVEEFIARTGNSNPLNGIISTWVQKNPSEALAYIETLDERQRARLYQSAAFSYVNSHPEEGFNWLLAQADRYPQLVESTIGSSINQNTINIAERMVTRTTNQGIRTRLITGIGNYKASQNPNQALSWLEGYRQDPAYPGAVQNVIANMSHQNPKGAAKAIESRINEKYATPLVGQIASNWYQANPRESMAWLQGLPEGEAKEQALGTIVSTVAHQDPDAAMDLLDNIPDGRRRTDAKRNIAYALLTRSPNDIENILEDLDITGQEATQLRALAKQRDQTRSTILRP